ncbi:MAG: hypothetical protein RML32_04855, partial [Gammaproteobacteria bacterium]|nr:hypothetical protein [Gammaproteobacteria bacterium]
MRLTIRWTTLACAIALGGATIAPGQPTGAAGAANPPIYQIEMIVFRGGGGPSEDWAQPGAKAPISTGETAQGAAQVGRYLGALPAADLQLGDAAAKLRASGYSILAHLGWKQTASAWGTRAGFTLARLGATVPGLSGLVYLERGTYLHLGMNLLYTGAGHPYRIDETRRIRFFEKQY